MNDLGEVIHFPEGLVGFPEAHDFRLLEHGDDYPFKFLHSIDIPQLSFVCMEAAAVRPNYRVPLSDLEASGLALERQEDALVLVLVVVPADPRQMTANLAGPIIINGRTRVGRQIQLDSRQYPLQHLVFGPKTETVVDFHEGLVGFADLHRFRIYEPQGGWPLKFLQSIEQENISFTCIDVGAIKPDFTIRFSKEDAEALALEHPEDAMILAMVVIPDDPRQMTANLAGPLVINTQTLVARQIILNTDEYPLKYPILAER